MEKLLGSLVGIWLLCGAAAAFLLIDKRPLSPEDFALGPISLMEVMR